jgi:hypothetical protein
MLCCGMWYLVFLGSGWVISLQVLAWCQLSDLKSVADINLIWKLCESEILESPYFKLVAEIQNYVKNERQEIKVPYFI